MPPSLDLGATLTAAYQFLDVCGYNYTKDHYESDHQLHPSRVMMGTESFRCRSRRTGSWSTSTATSSETSYGQASTTSVNRHSGLRCLRLKKIRLHLQPSRYCKCVREWRFGGDHRPLVCGPSKDVTDQIVLATKGRFSASQGVNSAGLTRRWLHRP